MDCTVRCGVADSESFEASTDGMKTGFEIGIRGDHGLVGKGGPVGKVRDLIR